MNLLKNPEYYKTFAVRIRSRSWPFHSRRQFFQLVICANVKPPMTAKPPYRQTAIRTGQQRHNPRTNGAINSGQVRCNLLRLGNCFQ